MGFFKDLLPGLPIVGDIISGKMAQENAKDARQWEERMSNTSHQREVQDLRLAGLNPILSGTGGAGASTPSASPAQTPDYGRGASSALQMKANLKLMDAQTENLDQQTRNANQEYWMDRYFRPLERMQNLTSGRTSIEAQKASIDNTRQGLANLQADLESKQISNQDAARLLKRKLNEPEFRDFIDSAPYADRQAVKQLLSGDLTGSALNKGLELLLRILGGK